MNRRLEKIELTLKLAQSVELVSLDGVVSDDFPRVIAWCDPLVWLSLREFVFGLSLDRSIEACW